MLPQLLIPLQGWLPGAPSPDSHTCFGTCNTRKLHQGKGDCDLLHILVFLEGIQDQRKFGGMDAKLTGPSGSLREGPYWELTGNPGASLPLVVTPGSPASPAAAGDRAEAEPSSSTTMSGISSGCPGRAVCHPADKGRAGKEVIGDRPLGTVSRGKLFWGLSPLLPLKESSVKRMKINLILLSRSGWREPQSRYWKTKAGFFPLAGLPLYSCAQASQAPSPSRAARPALGLSTGWDTPRRPQPGPNPAKV